MDISDEYDLSPNDGNDKVPSAVPVADRRGQRSGVLPMLIAGSIAGVIATAPMSACMLLLYRMLPRHERYSLPPRQVTTELANKAKVARHMTEPTQRIVTWLLHFGYGGASGVLFGPLARYVPAPTWLIGMAYGLSLLTGSYLGWLPAARILTPATKHPTRRSALMIVSHLVWGVSTSFLFERQRVLVRGSR